MIVVYFLLTFVVWCFIGDIICYFYTKWSMKTIYDDMKYTPESFEHEASRDICEERHYVPREITTMDIITNTILWPRTLVRAHRGHVKFVKKHKGE